MLPPPNQATKPPQPTPPLSPKPLSSIQQARLKLAWALDRQETHWTIIILSILDLLFTISELAYEFLQDGSCQCSGSCPEPPPVIEMFDFLSKFITTAFVVEIPLDLFGFGFAYLFSSEDHWLHCLDAIVVLGAFVLEVVLQGPVRKVASLVILLRFWRLVKVVTALEVGTTEYDEQLELDEKRTDRERWQAEKGRLKGEMEGLRRRLERYEGRSRKRTGERTSRKKSTN
ncbi:hypothetical protein JCM11641_000448 [Rhodosporidiobolus odoratus]